MTTPECTNGNSLYRGAPPQMVRDAVDMALGGGWLTSGPQVGLVLVGDPPALVGVRSSWLTETVVALAAGIYAERAFDRMPILADALEEAGCDSADILSHCRSDGPHVRGCWVVDLLLSKG